MAVELRTHYSSVSKLLHWVIALAVIVMLCVGFLLSSIPEKYQSMAYMLHKSTGLTILFLMMIRVIWIHVSGRPPLPMTISTWEYILSRVIQYGFYILLILMPVSGWLMSVADGRTPTYFGLFQLPFPGVGINKPLGNFMATCHEYIAWALIVFFVLHVSGALKHHFIDKDNVLKSMWPRK
jgi:cytochrome b561